MRNIFLGLLLLLCACTTNHLTFTGEIASLSGNKVKLYIQSPQNGSKELISQSILENGRFKLNIDKNLIPARIWLEIENHLDTTLILDAYGKTYLKQNEDGTYLFTGSALEAEFRTLREILKSQYDEIIAQIETEQLKYTESKDIEGVNACKIRKDRMKKLRNKYLTDAVMKNPKHNLSIFILNEEEVENKEELYRLLKPNNKRSNAFQILSNRVQ